MKINLLHMIEGSQSAKGLTIIIDVFRAFSVACYVINNGANKIIPIGDINEAYKLKEKYPDYILIGERDGVIQPGFDYGNSPTSIEQVDFKGKVVVQTTSSGTQGITNAIHADEIITASFVNADAVVRYVQAANPEEVSIVAMGNRGCAITDEDEYCALYIKSKLEDTPFDYEDIKKKLREGRGSLFFNPDNNDWAPERDFYLCTDLNRFNFVLKVEENQEGIKQIIKQNIYRLP